MVLSWIFGHSTNQRRIPTITLRIQQIIIHYLHLVTLSYLYYLLNVKIYLWNSRIFLLIILYLWFSNSSSFVFFRRLPLSTLILWLAWKRLSGGSFSLQTSSQTPERPKANSILSSFHRNLLISNKTSLKGEHHWRSWVSNIFFWTNLTTWLDFFLVSLLPFSQVLPMVTNDFLFLAHV